MLAVLAACGDAPTNPITAAADADSPVDVDGDREDGGYSQGCGFVPEFRGHRYMTILSGGIERQFYLSIRDDYDPHTPQALYVGIHGRDYDGIRMREYLGLEPLAERGEIFVYPDGLLKEWELLGEAVGWQNGPAADWLGGMEDLVFFDDMLGYLLEHLCIDEERIFAAGQGWGGDFSNVLGCYRSDRFRAFVSVAANDPFYLPLDNGPLCSGAVDAWVMHGKGATFPNEVGHALRDFWLAQNGCDTAPPDLLAIGDGARPDDECLEYRGCARRTLFCSLTAEVGDQIPWDYFARVSLEFFRGFE